MLWLRHLWIRLLVRCCERCGNSREWMRFYRLGSFLAATTQQLWQGWMGELFVLMSVSRVFPRRSQHEFWVESWQYIWWSLNPVARAAPLSGPIWTGQFRNLLRWRTLALASWIPVAATQWLSCGFKNSTNSTRSQYFDWFSWPSSSSRRRLRRDPWPSRSTLNAWWTSPTAANPWGSATWGFQGCDHNKSAVTKNPSAS